MKKLQLPEGVQVVITPDMHANTENRARLRAGGTEFVPAWNVWAYGPIAKFPKEWKQKNPSSQRNEIKHRCVKGCWTMNSSEERGNVAVLIGAYSFEVEGFCPQHFIDKFPLPWAPRPLAEEVSAWLFSDSGATIYIAQDYQTNE